MEVEVKGESSEGRESPAIGREEEVEEGRC